jgi:hypothetical protein
MSDMENGLPNSVEGATNANSGTGGASTSNDVQTGVTLEQVEELLERRFQSFKDKRMGALEKQVNVISERLAKDLEKEGFDPDEVKQVTDRLRKPPEQKSDVTPTPTPGTGEAEMPDMDKILSDAGIKDDDPDVIAFGQKSFANEEEKMKEALNLFARRLNPTVVTPAAVASPKGASIPLPDLREEYEKELGKIPRGQRDAVFKLRLKYRAKGLDV